MTTQRTDHVAEARERLIAATEALIESDAYQRHLRMLSKFHRYSWNNTLLIALQCPHATAVAGYEQWKELGRQVRKGEKAIRILAPRPSLRLVTNDDGTEEEQPRVTFTSACVFDVSQTDAIPGHPRPFVVPTIPDPVGDPALARRLGRALVDWLQGPRGLTVQSDDDRGQARAAGWYCHERREIYVRPAAPAKMLAVAIHEAAHHLSHDADDGRHGYAANEVIAQSIAFVVCDRFGIDAGDMSTAYVACWLRDDPEGFRKGQAFIQEAAHALIAAMEPALAAAEEAPAALAA